MSLHTQRITAGYLHLHRIRRCGIRALRVAEQMLGACVNFGAATTDHQTALVIVKLMHQPHNLLNDSGKAMVENSSAQTGDLAARFLKRRNRTRSRYAAGGFASGHLVLTAVLFDIALQLQHLLNDHTGEGLVLQPVHILGSNAVTLDNVTAPVGQRVLVDIAAAPQKQTPLAGHTQVHVDIGEITVDITHGRGHFVNLTGTNRHTLAMGEDVNNKRIHSVFENILRVFQQRAAGEVSHVNGVAVGLRIEPAIPVLHQHCQSFVIAVFSGLRFRHANAFVTAAFVLNVHGLLRIMGSVPRKGMPGHLDAGAGILNVLIQRIPQESLNGPANQRDVTFAAVHRLIPANLRNRRANANKVLNAGAVKLFVPVVRENIANSVVHIIHNGNQVGAFRGQLHVRHIVHLVSDDTVIGAFQRLKLHRLFLLRIFIFVLPRVIHQNDFAVFLCAVVVIPAPLLEGFEIGIRFLDKCAFRLVKRLHTSAGYGCLLHS